MKLITKLHANIVTPRAKGYAIGSMPKTFLVILFLMLFIIGCNDGPNETSHPLFVKYRKAHDSRKYSEASEYLKRYLKVRPDSAPAHLAMAALCEENLDDQLSAIFHYRRFLEIEPHSAQRHDVRKWIEAAEKRYYYKAKIKFNDPEDIASLQNTIYEFEQTLKLAQNENRRQSALVNERREKIAELEHELKLKNIEATDVSILKEQLKERNEVIVRLEIERKSLSLSDKEKENRLSELRESIKNQNAVVAELREKLVTSQKEAAKIPELSQQLEKLKQELAETQMKLTNIKLQNQSLLLESELKQEKNHAQTTISPENPSTNQ